MNREFPIKTTVRFSWRDSGGALRLGVGMTQCIGRSSVCIRAHDIPDPGARVQVIVDMPRVRADARPGRLIGQGIAVRQEQAYGQITGFAAEVRFQSNWACRPAALGEEASRRWNTAMLPAREPERLDSSTELNPRATLFYESNV